LHTVTLVWNETLVSVIDLSVSLQLLKRPLVRRKMTFLNWCQAWWNTPSVGRWATRQWEWTR